MKKLAIELPLKKIKKFCIVWEIQEFAVFGSILGQNFDLLKSDIDVLILLKEDSDISLFEIVKMKRELEGILNRKVDILEKTVIQNSNNPYKRDSILNSAEVLYERAA